jgi:hypothetical protein
MVRTPARTLSLLPRLLLTAAAAALVSCGGAGGSGTGETIPGLVLVRFEQSGQDNVPLNRVLTFTFSSPIDPRSVGPASIQIREGPTFGAAVFGRYVIDDHVVRFEPRLSGLCDLSDGGLQPDRDYRVSVVGSPEEFAVRNLSGLPMQGTVVASFHTRLDTDPELFEDQVPATPPSVLSTSPVDGAHPTHPDPAVAAPVLVRQGNRVVIRFSENLDPCSVNANTVRFFQHAVGEGAQTPSDPPGSRMPNGFDPEQDQTPTDPFTWGSGRTTAPPRRVRCSFALEQDFLNTALTLTPTFGEFADNALLVVEVTNQVRDFGGNALLPSAFGFVTENRPAQTLPRLFEFDGDVPILGDLSTGEVNTARSISRAQGFLLFAGDGDNGAVLDASSGPDAANGPAGCAPARVQGNDGSPDDFDPLADVVLDTGATRNTCVNSTDGSTAVVFEFRSFHVRAGVTVRILGRNPAIILTKGDVAIDAGARVLVRGDGVGGAPSGVGASGQWQTTNDAPGGTGVAGGGAGGAGIYDELAPSFSRNGEAGFGSPDAFLSPGVGGGATAIRVGAGRGTGSIRSTNQNPVNLTGSGGGGGGHAQAPTFVNAGAFSGAGTDARAYDFPADPDGKGGRGGAIYGGATGRMPTAEAGSGGGGGGTARGTPWTTGAFANTVGGGGGAGGGFVDFTSSRDIRVFGTIDAAGSRGGTGATAFFQGGGGGGGGSGGGIRLLTPGRVEFGAATIVTAAGGAGGLGTQPGAGNPNIANAGGPGAVGRLVIEDGDSVVTGFTAAATVIPGEGASGFYRGPFDASRFVGGGLRPVVVTDLIDMGPTSPLYLDPVQSYGVREDFVVGVPSVASRGVGRTALFIEAQGFSTLSDGSVDPASGTGWKSVGYFTDSGAESFPTWTPAAKPPVTDVPASQRQPGNTGDGIAQLNGRGFVQLRLSFFLSATQTPNDPGPYLDRWTPLIRYDQ